MYFFFQAEDGIRDIGVTGVQTCALPICRVARHLGRRTSHARLNHKLRGCVKSRSARFEATRHGMDHGDGAPGLAAGGGRLRSEERRVGKEWRSWGSPYY